jgi:hypothetical protein
MAEEQPTSDLVTVTDTDYLDEDPPIRNQQYVCLSFINPEEVIKDKEAYFLRDFFDQYIARNVELVDGLEKLYPDKQDELRSIKEQYNIFFDADKIDSEYKAFKSIHDSRISSRYMQENNLRTCIRGIKVRGSYETLKEAQIRAEVLKRKDNNKHNIYVAQVGCWCPLGGNPDEIDTEYNETQLNTLMREYNKNREKTEIFFNDRKNDLIERTKKHNERISFFNALIKDANATFNEDEEDDDTTDDGVDETSSDDDTDDDTDDDDDHDDNKDNEDNEDTIEHDPRSQTEGESSNSLSTPPTIPDLSTDDPWVSRK